MQRLTTLFLLVGITFTAQAQTVDDYQPDSDGDGCIGMSDLLSLLSVFGSCEAEAFACGDPVNYQGYDYATVLIGEQCWFAENLRSENYENGDAIPSNLSNSEWGSTSSGAVTVYNEDASLLETYGRLYNWYAVGDARGLCPSGWHVPTDGEWMTMEMALGMSEAEANETGWRGTDQGAQMKTVYGWSGDAVGTNSSGFSGLPGGFRGLSGGWGDAEYLGYWWSSSPSPYFNINFPNNSYFWMRALDGYDDERVLRNGYVPNQGYSVRCIQDSAE